MGPFTTGKKDEFVIDYDDEAVRCAPLRLPPRLSGDCPGMIPGGGGGGARPRHPPPNARLRPASCPAQSQPCNPEPWRQTCIQNLKTPCANPACGSGARWCWRRASCAGRRRRRSRPPRWVARGGGDPLLRRGGLLRQLGGGGVWFTHHRGRRPRPSKQSASASANPAPPLATNRRRPPPRRRRRRTRAPSEPRAHNLDSKPPALAQRGCMCPQSQMPLLRWMHP